VVAYVIILKVATETRGGVDWAAVIQQGGGISLQGPMSHQEAKEIIIEEIYIKRHKAVHIYALNAGQAILSACQTILEKTWK